MSTIGAADDSFDLSNWVKHVLSDLDITNVSSNLPMPYYFDYTRPRFLIGVWELLLFLVGVPANALVLRLASVIIRKQTHQENQHLCILSTASADFLFTCIHCPLMFVSFALSLDLDPALCKFLYFITHLCTVASSLSLLCLNLDKFVSLRFPLRYYAIITCRLTKACLSVCWIVSLVWALFFVFGPYTEFQVGCEVYTTEAYGYLTFVTLFFALPTGLSLAISSYVVMVARRARKSDYQRVVNGAPLDTHSKLNSVTRKRSQRREIFQRGINSDGSFRRRRTRGLRTVTFVFSTTLWSFLTLIPYRIGYIVYHFSDSDLMVRAFFVLFALMVSNASGNPFVTITTQHQYRSWVTKLIWRLKNTDPLVVTQSSRRSFYSMTSVSSRRGTLTRHNAQRCRPPGAE